MAKRKIGVERMTVTVPQRIRSEMKDFDVNWSKVATLAFEDYMLQAALSEESEDDDVDGHVFEKMNAQSVAVFSRLRGIATEINLTRARARARAFRVKSELDDPEDRSLDSIYFEFFGERFEVHPVSLMGNVPNLKVVLYLSNGPNGEFSKDYPDLPSDPKSLFCLMENNVFVVPVVNEGKQKLKVMGVEHSISLRGLDGQTFESVLSETVISLRTVETILTDSSDDWGESYAMALQDLDAEDPE